ncbi:hypothetical protein O181_041547 [Austropuccinia psidii MF-1]|uniref:Uncharacterized protein n=1 Tax=Austropuccinia psidii MF-1 TaxID=1389203 RepID=A0A9Q3DGX1_9BASI|nr:hypothetical protein [Austropuccinia psidii MF-1]
MFILASLVASQDPANLYKFTCDNQTPMKASIIGSDCRDAFLKFKAVDALVIEGEKIEQGCGTCKITVTTPKQSCDNPRKLSLMHAVTAFWSAVNTCHGNTTTVEVADDSPFTMVISEGPGGVCSNVEQHV